MRLTYLLLEGKFSCFECCLSAGWMPCETKQAPNKCRRNQNKMRNGERSDRCSNLCVQARCIHKPQCLNGPGGSYAIVKSCSSVGGEGWPCQELSDSFVALRWLQLGDWRQKRRGINKFIETILLNVLIACNPQPVQSTTPASKVSILDCFIVIEVYINCHILCYFGLQGSWGFWDLGATELSENSLYCCVQNHQLFPI